MMMHQDRYLNSQYHHEIEGSLFSLHRYYDYAAHAYVCMRVITYWSPSESVFVNSHVNAMARRVYDHVIR
jgi:hypothetical protein